MFKGPRLVIALWLLLTLTACSPLDLQRAKFREEYQDYMANIPKDANGNSNIEKDLLFNDLLLIAARNNQKEQESLFRMMRQEAYKKKIGLSNTYDSLEKRYAAQDASLFPEAEEYLLSLKIDGKCAEFGYKEGTPEFKKCVFDLKMQLAALKMQQQQLMMQARPAPIYTMPATTQKAAPMPSPAPIYIPQPAQTNCTTYGNQTNCSSR